MTMMTTMTPGKNSEEGGPWPFDTCRFGLSEAPEPPTNAEESDFNEQNEADPYDLKS